MCIIRHVLCTQPIAKGGGAHGAGVVYEGEVRGGGVVRRRWELESVTSRLFKDIMTDGQSSPPTNKPTIQPKNKHRTNMRQCHREVALPKTIEKCSM